jgi:hypothetical protein
MAQSRLTVRPRCRYRLRIIEKPSRRQAGAVDRQIKNIEPVVVADNIVKLLPLDTAAEVDFGIGDAFLVLQHLADNLPVGSMKKLAARGV